MPHTGKVVVRGPKHGEKISMICEVIFSSRIWSKVINGKSHRQKANFNKNVPWLRRNNFKAIDGRILLALGSKNVSNNFRIFWRPSLALMDPSKVQNRRTFVLLNGPVGPNWVSEKL